MTDDEEYDEEVLARLADSIQSEGGRPRKHVSWNTTSQEHRSESLDPSTRHTLPSRRPLRPSVQTVDSREGEHDTRGRSHQREVGTGDGRGGSEHPTTQSSPRASRSRADRRRASLVFLGFWALFGVGTLVGNRSGPPATSSVSSGRVLTPIVDQVAPAFNPPKVIRSDYEPEGFNWVEVLADAGSTDHEDLPPPEEGLPLEQIIGRMSAWTCTILYLTSRLPQIWKNVSTLIHVIFSALTCRSSSLGSPLRDSPCSFSSSLSLGTRSMFRPFSHLRNWLFLGPGLRHIFGRVFREYPRLNSLTTSSLIFHKLYPGKCWDTHVRHHDRLPIFSIPETDGQGEICLAQPSHRSRYVCRGRGAVERRCHWGW